ncbi:MAG: hypothetical protein OEV43_08555, partial [Coriobacteriia bacterium]|nr:hypothetical protein [Coriobacteriia bacterium]
MDDLNRENDEHTSDGAVDYAARRVQLRSEKRRDRSVVRFWRSYWDRPVWQRVVIGLPSVLLALVLLG